MTKTYVQVGPGPDLHETPVSPGVWNEPGGNYIKEAIEACGFDEAEFDDAAEVAFDGRNTQTLVSEVVDEVYSMAWYMREKDNA